MQKGRARSRIGISIVAGRGAVLSAAPRWPCGVPLLWRMRPRGCDVAAYFNSSGLPSGAGIQDQEKTNVDNAVAEPDFSWSDQGMANGLHYFNRNTKEDTSVYAKRGNKAISLHRLNAGCC